MTWQTHDSPIHLLQACTCATLNWRSIGVSSDDARVRLVGGEWLAVQIRSDSWSLGLVARVGRRGVLLGYFFGPRFAQVPRLSDAEGLVAANAVLVGMFGDLGIQEGTWRILGRQSGWDELDWPLPQFVRRDSLDYLVKFIRYSASDISVEI